MPFAGIEKYIIFDDDRAYYALTQPELCLKIIASQLCRHKKEHRQHLGPKDTSLQRKKGSAPKYLSFDHEEVI